MNWKLICAVTVLALAVPADAVRGQESETQEQEAATQDVKKSVDELGDQATDTFDAIKSGDFRTAASGIGEILKGYALPAVTAFVVFVLAYFFAAFVARVCSAPIRSRVDETLGRFVGKVIFYLIIVGAGLGVLQYFGIGVTSFAAVIGAAGFAVGLGVSGHAFKLLSGSHAACLSTVQSRRRHQRRWDHG